MLYPFSLTLDLYIQAESFEEAKKLAEAYVQVCSDCENEVVISNVEGVKYEIDLRFLEFVERTGKEPEYVECQIVWKETGDDKRVTIKLSLSINDDDNDNVFYYCNGIESFQQLAEYGMREFIVTYCWSFF